MVQWSSVAGYAACSKSEVPNTRSKYERWSNSQVGYWSVCVWFGEWDESGAVPPSAGDPACFTKGSIVLEPRVNIAPVDIASNKLPVVQRLLADGTEDNGYVW